MLMAEGGFFLSPPDAPRSHAGGDPAPDHACAHLFLRGGAVSVAESVLAPPGPIPNPVVTQGSAGEYCGGDPVGGEAAADTAPPRQQVRTVLPRGGAAAARWAHNPKVAGSNPAPATTQERP